MCWVNNYVCETLFLFNKKTLMICLLDYKVINIYIYIYICSLTNCFFFDRVYSKNWIKRELWFYTWMQLKKKKKTRERDRERHYEGKRGKDSCDRKGRKRCNEDKWVCELLVQLLCHLLMSIYHFLQLFLPFLLKLQSCIQHFDGHS